MPEDRSRSASPARDATGSEARGKKAKTGGFKWKDKKPRNGDGDERDSGRLERGYRNRSPRRDKYRDRDGAGHAQDGKGGKEADKARGPDDPARPREPRDRAPGERGGGGGGGGGSGGKPMKELSSAAPGKEKRAKPPKPPVSTEAMIVVNVNDRLGTKAAIPCLASDNIKAFKAVVAAHIGRQPHEIMLKRQGERPFKDQLTLEDYGVSHGVQLDLELDTGD